MGAGARVEPRGRIVTRRRPRATRKPAPKVGRPPLGPAKRSRRVQILVTPEVDRRIAEAADRALLSRSDWGAAALERALEAQTDPPTT